MSATWRTPASLASIPKDAMYYARNDTAHKGAYAQFKAEKEQRAKVSTLCKAPRKSAATSPVRQPLTASGLSPIKHTENPKHALRWKHTCPTMCNLWQQQVVDNKAEVDALQQAVAVAEVRRLQVAEVKRLHSAVLHMQQQQQQQQQQHQQQQQQHQRYKKATEERSAQLEAASVLSMLGVAADSRLRSLNQDADSSSGVWDSEDETTAESGSDTSSSRKRPLDVYQEKPPAKRSPVLLSMAVQTSPALPTSANIAKLAHGLMLPTGSDCVPSASPWILSEAVQWSKQAKTQQGASGYSQQLKKPATETRKLHISWQAPMSLR